MSLLLLQILEQGDFLWILNTLNNYKYTLNILKDEQFHIDMEYSAEGYRIILHQNNLLSPIMALNNVKCIEIYLYCFDTHRNCYNIPM